jgi:hypothetical protein
MKSLISVLLGASLSLTTVVAHAELNLEQDYDFHVNKNSNMKLSWYEDDYHEYYYKNPENLRDLDWVISREGYLPATAVVGGAKTDCTFYLCKAFYMESIIPGKVVDGNCDITYNGKEVVISEGYKVLTGDGFRWVPASYGNVPANAITGGMDQNGDPFYVCRARYLHGLHPGKLSGTFCHFGYAGNEIFRQHYEVLTDIHSG